MGIPSAIGTVPSELKDRVQFTIRDFFTDILSGNLLPPLDLPCLLR
jgi:hypothetical protein